jgi:hypothetical protein
MWVEIRKVPNLMIAEMWKELLEGEGIPTKILPQNPEGGEFSPYCIYVTQTKRKVVEEIMRRL